jgi:hypothetical protein
MYQETIAFDNWLSQQPNLTADDKDYLQDSKSWSNFLEDEIDYNKFLAAWGPVNPFMQPFWTNPVLTQGKLGVIGGSFPIDPYDTFLHIDKFSITPLAATPYSWYFMPPVGLTAGQHNYIIDSPLYSETIFPVFSMTLYMTADNLSLLKGQSTMYHVVLSGLNGLPGGAWGGASDPTDLVGSSDLNAAKKAVGTMRTGYITLSITNGSPGVISMQNQFKTLNAASFVPSGSSQTDGGVTALIKGSFSINGEAHAYLDPEIGVGIPPGTTLPAGLTNPLTGSPGGNWLPSFSLNYDPLAFKTSSFMTSCYGYGVTPPATPPASIPCVESVIDDLMPIKAKPIETQDNPNKPVEPTQQITDAEKRLQDATEKEKAAFQKVIAANNGLKSQFQYGLDQADPALQSNLQQAEQKLEKAREDKEKAATTQAATPTNENQNTLVSAEKEEADAQSAVDAVKQKVIDGFNPETKKAYGEAVDDLKKATNDWSATNDEKREAYEALQKLKQPQPAKPPVDEVM